MRRDERPSVAALEAVRQLAVELTQALPRGFRLVLATQEPPQLADDLGEADRVEPDVRVAVSGRVDVERGPLAPVDRMLDRGLEAASDVDDGPGVEQEIDVARRELEVVWLDARRSQVLD